MFEFIDLDKKTNKYLLYTASFILIFIVGYIDYISGNISLSLLYVLPIAAVSWFWGRWQSFAYALIASAVEFFANITDVPPLLTGIDIWNLLGRFCFFLIIAYLISYIKKLLESEIDAARKDFLTDVNNARSFYEQAGRELEKSRRYKTPMTVAYMDLDNFKSVNDTRGHMEGDRLLKIVARVIGKYTRTLDIVARLGGDEFAVLFPESNYRQSHIVIQRLQERLLKTTRAENFPVSYSIGAVTFLSVPDSIDSMIRKADEVMYEVKKSGKNKSSTSSSKNRFYRQPRMRRSFSVQ